MWKVFLQPLLPLLSLAASRLTGKEKEVNPNLSGEGTEYNNNKHKVYDQKGLVMSWTRTSTSGSKRHIQRTTFHSDHYFFKRKKRKNSELAYACLPNDSGFNSSRIIRFVIFILRRPTLSLNLVNDRT